MKLKIFGDTISIDWSAIGIKMPFAPMHELAQLYELERMSVLCPIDYTKVTDKDIQRTFETNCFISENNKYLLLDRINTRVQNTMSALDQATSDTICINLGGGYHHAGQYPETGYAYSLINDIIWAVDYQLAQNKTVGIIDLDFHFGGGTYSYAQSTPTVAILDVHHFAGVLYKNQDPAGRVTLTQWETGKLGPERVFATIPDTVDKIILNIGTDWYKNDTLFGQNGCMEAEDILFAWQQTIMQITANYTPLAITMGGGYGPHGLKLYQSLISWLSEL